MDIKQPSYFKRKFYFTLLFISCTLLQSTFAQNHPGTGTIAPCGSCVPTGWTLDAGSPDVSDAAGWGFSGLGAGQTPWKNTIPAIPNGETRWLSAHSTEVASMMITGLTVGTSYTLEFYYMTAIVASPQLGGYGGIASTKIRYSIDGGAMVSKAIPATDTWYKETVVFTASATSVKFTYYGGDHDGFFPGSASTEGDLTNISFKPNGTVPTTPACPTINLTATPFVSICSGQSTTLTATGPSTANYTYTWLPSGSGTTITVSPTDTTAYQVTADSAGCKKTVSSVVVVVPNPVVTATSATVCPGQTATLTASGAAAYTWSPGTNLSATTGSSVNSTPPGNTSYTVTGTTDGCSATAVSSVTIAGSIPVSVNSATICSGQSATLTASGGTTYSWSPATNLSASTGASVNSTPPGNASYTVTGTTNGCSGTAVATVTISAALAVTATSTSVCAGSNGTLTAGGATTYVWSDGSTANTLTAAPVSPTSYTVTGTSNGCTGTAVGTINITPDDDATFSYSPATVCKTGGSDPTPVIAATTGGTFSCPTLSTELNTTTGVITLASTAIGTYTITYTTAGTCPDSKTFIVAIVNVPSATFSYAGPYCQNAADPLPTFPSGSSAGVFSASPAGLSFVSTGSGEVDLSASTANTYTVTNTIAAGGGCPAATATNTITVDLVPVTTVDNQTVCGGVSATLTAGGATSYVWSDGSTAGTLTAAPLSPTSYTVTGTTNGCSSSSTGTITVNTVPTVTVNSPAICNGQSATLTATGATTYVWSDATTANPKTVSPSTTTPYSVIGTTSGCSASALAVVTVNQVPVITVNSPTICVGASATLTAGGGSTYTWSTGASGNSITVSPVSPTSYTVSDNTAGCSGSAVSTVSVNTPPSVTVNSAIICVGQSATITASGASSYLWSTGSASSSITVSPVSPTSYTVIGNPGGCSGSAVSTITVMPLPVVTANTASVCAGSPATLTAGGATSYVWSTGAVTASTTVNPVTPTNYIVTGTTAGCSNTAVGVVTVFPIPTAGFSSSPNIVGVLSPVVNFTDGSSSDVTSWFWTFGDGDSIAGTQNPTHTYPSIETTYTVTLNVINGGLCTSSTSEIVIIGPEFSFYIPNAFSPNDDQKNDFFGGTGTGITKYKLLVFDRWGNQIFATEDLHKVWDGKAKSGSDITEQDVYVWKVNIIDVFKKEHEFLGTVTIVK